MPNTTLAAIWKDLSVEERLLILIDRYRASTPPAPSSLRMSGYQMAIDDVEFYVLGSKPLPGEDAN